jgi:hypothetical protein
MNKLEAIIAYLCTHYPHKGELSKARLTKLVYLADWFSALGDNRQLTNIKWLFNHYGPYVDDVVFAAEASELFYVSNEQNRHGNKKNLIKFNGPCEETSLSTRDKQILDLVITKTKRMYFNDFIEYVYSTYPVRAKNRYEVLELITLAQEYKALSLEAATI